MLFIRLIIFFKEERHFFTYFAFHKNNYTLTASALSHQALPPREKDNTHTYTQSIKATGI